MAILFEKKIEKKGHGETASSDLLVKYASFFGLCVLLEVISHLQVPARIFKSARPSNPYRLFRRHIERI
jgi:hypothetical protein